MAQTSGAPPEMTYSGFLSQEQRVALDEGERLDGARPGAVGLRCHAGERGGSGMSGPRLAWSSVGE